MDVRRWLVTWHHKQYCMWRAFSGSKWLLNCSPRKFTNPDNGTGSSGRSTRRGTATCRCQGVWLQTLGVWVGALWGNLRGQKLELLRNWNGCPGRSRSELDTWMKEVALFEKALVIGLFQSLLLLWMCDVYGIYCINLPPSKFVLITYPQVFKTPPRPK